MERFVYPTGEGDRVVALDPSSGSVLATAESKTGGHPTRLTASPDGSIWVQEAGKHTVAVYEPSALELVKRFQTGTEPILGTFTYDGSYAYTGHADDNFVQVVDTADLKALAHIPGGFDSPNGGRAAGFLPHLRDADRRSGRGRVYQQDWEVNSSTITSNKENTIALESAPRRHVPAHDLGRRSLARFRRAGRCVQDFVRLRHAEPGY